MLSIDEIKRFMNDDRASEKKRCASLGLKYYKGHHDIRNYRLYYVNSDGMLVEDRQRSNIKISHPFFTELVDQAVQYMLSGNGEIVKSDDPELQKRLDLYFNRNENFLSELYQMLTDCMVKGYSYLYAYKASNNMTAFQCADSMGVVEVRANEASDAVDHVIYYYVDRIGKDRKRITRIQVWDSKQIYHYVQVGDEQMELDTSIKFNPAPHIIYSYDDGTEDKYGSSYGVIPFFRMDNCREQTSSLMPVKDLIDDYDLMSCGLSNNLQDASEYLVVVKGFQGENLDELQQNIKAKKIIGVDGESGGGVDFRTVEIPYQARLTKMQEDEKNIYKFGFGFNSAQLGDGNITNVVIKSRYALLDMKCNKLTITLTSVLRNIMNVILDEINESMNTQYSQADVYFDFTREVMTNAQDNAQIELIEAQTQGQLLNNVLNIAQQVDDETVLKKICETIDVDYNEVKARMIAKEQESVVNQVSAIIPEDEKQEGETA